ncbi:hypothetical protein JL720_16978 [Aureococcus anophagefferens]|nr:hypothetical protein JL720_16978 [Aureococcus anophagefferens]
MSLALSPDALSIAVASASRLSVHGASAGAGSGNTADGAELYACYALPGGAFARHVARWAVAGGEPAAWDGDKRGVSALAAHRRGAVAAGSTRVRLLQTTGTGAKRALAGTHATEGGVWSLRLAAPGLEVCARAAPRAEGEEAVEVAVCLGDGRLQVADRVPDAARLWTAARRRWPSPSSATTSGPRAARRARRRPRPWTSRATPACARPSTAGAAKARRGRAPGEEPKQPAVLGFAALGAAPGSGPTARTARRGSGPRPRRPTTTRLGDRRGFRSPGDARAGGGGPRRGRRPRGRGRRRVRRVARGRARPGRALRRRRAPRDRAPAHGARDGRGDLRWLAPSLALPTLDALAARLERSPLRAADLAGWVKALLLQHASHLATLPKLADTLAAPVSPRRRRAAQVPLAPRQVRPPAPQEDRRRGLRAASAEVTPLNVVAADATDDEDEEEEDDDMEEEEDDDDDESEEEEDDDDDDDSSDDDDE